MLFRSSSESRTGRSRGWPFSVVAVAMPGGTCFDLCMGYRPFVRFVVVKLLSPISGVSGCLLTGTNLHKMRMKSSDTDERGKTKQNKSSSDGGPLSIQRTY